MPCSIPPPVLKYQHFASNGPYAPRACKPKSIATYYKTALQILHRSQNLLLGMLLACQLAEQRLGLSKEICKRMAGYADAHVKGDNSLGLESGPLSCKLSLGRGGKINCRVSRMPPPHRGKAAKSPWVSPEGLSMQRKEDCGPAALAPSGPCSGRSMAFLHGHHDRVAAAGLVPSCMLMVFRNN